MSEATTVIGLSEEDRTAVLTDLYRELAAGYSQQDYVREIRVNPADVDYIREWIATLPLPEMVMQLACVSPSEGTTMPGLIRQSQIETQWLAAHYNSIGLIEHIQKQDSPIILTHKDLKMLYLLDALQECKAGSKSQILVPGDMRSRF